MSEFPGKNQLFNIAISDDDIYALGYLYTVVPVGVGAFIMLAVALLVNNIPINRKYPEFWL